MSSVWRPGKSSRNARGLTTAPERRLAPGARPFSTTATGTSPRPLADVGALLEELPEADRGGEARRARADDEDADVDPLVGRVGRLRDELPPVERRREVGGTRAHAPRAFTSSVSRGTIWCRSPTTPRSAYSKMGAFGSLLMATMVPAACMPTLCWIAPEIPQAM